MVGDNKVMKGVIYIMTSAVSGLIKIGRTSTNNFQERMRHLESNGYYNVVGLRRFFAIEVEDYEEKENLLHEIFGKHQVGDSELFALDEELVKQLLLSFEGRVIYPNNIDKEKEFDQVSESRRQSRLFSFYKKGLKNGDIVTFIDDKNIVARIVGEREVEFEGQKYKLAPLTRKLYERMGRVNASGAYQGARYFTYKNKRLIDLPDVD